MLFLPPCHLNGLSGVSVAVGVESPVPSPFFSGQARLHFLWPYQPLVSKIVTQPLGELNLTPPSPRPSILSAESNEKNN